MNTQHWKSATRCILPLLMFILSERQAVAGSSCDIPYGMSCYSFHPNGTDWSNNRQSCKLDRGDLVAMETEDEYSFIKARILSRDHLAWDIGIHRNSTDDNQARWMWISGKPFVMNWLENDEGEFATLNKSLQAQEVLPATRTSPQSPGGYICERHREIPQPMVLCSLVNVTTHAYPLSNSCAINPGEVTSAPGIFDESGGSTSFSGNNKSFMAINVTEHFLLNNSFTLLFWMHPEKTKKALLFGLQDGHQNGLELLGGMDETRHIIISYSSSRSSEHQMDTITKVTLRNNQWQLFGIVYDHRRALMAIWKDGQFVGNLTDVWLRLSPNSRWTLWLGGTPQDSNKYGFIGRMAYVQLYPEALQSSALIKSVWNKCNARPATRILEIVYGFNEFDMEADRGVYTHLVGTSHNVSLEDGPFGNPKHSFRFKAQEHSYVQIDGDGNLDFHYSLTILTWLYSEEPRVSDSTVIAYSPRNANITSGFRLVLTEGGILQIINNGSTYELKKEVRSGNWHFIGITYNCSDRKLRLWVNGSEASNWKLKEPRLMTELPVWIGRNPRTYDGQFNGRVSCVHFVSTSLNADEVQQYNNTCKPPVLTAISLRVRASLPNKIWSDALLSNESTEYRQLEGKLQKNVKELYSKRENFSTDQKIAFYAKGFLNMTLISFREGSVVVDFKILFDSVLHDEIVRLQEDLEIHHHIGTLPAKPINLTASKVINSRPRNLTVVVHGDSNLTVSWQPLTPAELSHREHSYKVFYKKIKEQTWNVADVAPNTTSITLRSLSGYTTYGIRVLVNTAEGNGISSAAKEIRTMEGVPSRGPEITHVWARSTDHISIEWRPVKEEFLNGRLLGYKVYYRTLQSQWVHIFTRSDIWFADIRNLEPYTAYEIQVRGSTRKGDGKPSELVTLTTREQVPQQAPRNIRVATMSSATNLTISWQTVNQTASNGEVLGYRLTYTALRRGNKDVSESKANEIRIHGRTSVKTTLTGLTPFTVYTIAIAAFNSKGVGMESEAVRGETCRCHKYIRSNYWSSPPYVSKSTHGVVGGLFATSVAGMIRTACQSCYSGHGDTIIELQDKLSATNVVEEIDNGTTISFPINDKIDKRKYMKDQVFVPIVESLGISFLTLPQSTQKKTAYTVIYTTFTLWPLVLVVITSSLVAGSVIWASDAGNPTSFPRNTIKGISEGTWWAFVTMTKVGYGDRVPRSILARILATIWTLTGLVIIAVIQGIVTTTFTSDVVDSPTILYGTKVGALSNSSAYRLGVLRNSRMTRYETLTELRRGLLDGEVKGILVDTYIAGYKEGIFSGTRMRVNKIIPYSTGYGLVLSGDAIYLEHAIKDYMIKHQMIRSKLIENNVQPVKEPPTSQEEENVSMLLDSSTDLYRNVVLFFGLALLCCWISGVVFELRRRRREGLLSMSDSDRESLRKYSRLKEDIRSAGKEMCDTTIKKLKQIRSIHLRQLKSLAHAKMFDQPMDQHTYAPVKSPSPVAWN